MIVNLLLPMVLRFLHNTDSVLRKDTNMVFDKTIVVRLPNESTCRRSVDGFPDPEDVGAVFEADIQELSHLNCKLCFRIS